MADETRQLGRYELIERIAVGGMGEIYLAKSRGAAGFEKTVIIKKILDHLAEEDEFVTKFLDEGRIVVNLTHGNIVPVFDMGEEDGEYFIAMDYVPGRDLRDVLKRLRTRDELIPIPLAVHIGVEVCKGLDYAHRRTDEAGEPLGIVHRDVSPSNILISRDGEVKVIDFGIARAASRAAKTVSGRIQGKICYMSPEQAAGESVDQRSDIFSTGVVLYEMLTGTRPFQGDSDLQSLDLVRQCEFEAPSALNPDIPAELDQIIDRALCRERDRRYQSIDELHVDLLEWLYSGGRAVTSQQLAAFTRELFPDGVEREDLRRARDASSTSADKPMNLDEALNAELERMQQEVPSPAIDPLRTTATELVDGHDSGTSSAPDLHNLDAGSESTSADSDEPSAGSTGADSDEPSPPTVEAERKDDRPDGFKRWLAIALGIGIIAGAALIYAYAATDAGEVEVQAEPADDEPRQAWVTVAPADATLEIDNGEQTATGKARITVSPGKQVLIEASHPDCASATRVVNYAGAAQPIGLTLECEDPAPKLAQALPDAGAEAAEKVLSDANPNSAEPESAGPESSKQDRAPKGPTYTLVRFATEPEGGTVELDGEPVDGAQRLRIGQSVDVHASLAGYAPVDKTLRVTHSLGGRHTIKLEQLPTGCLEFRAMEPAVARVEIDGVFKAHTGSGRWKLPVGERRVTVSNKTANKPAETHTVDIEAGKCTNLVVWEPTTHHGNSGTN